MNLLCRDWRMPVERERRKSDDPWPTGAAPSFVFSDFQVKHLIGADHYARLTAELGRNIAMNDPGKIAERQTPGAQASIGDALPLINGW